jgi:hypothetical protein
MSNQYRARTPAAVAMFEEGVFEREFTVTEEQDWLDRGLLELVPRPYRVLTDNYTILGWPVPQDAVVEATFPIEVEAALIDGGHLARVRRDAHPTVDPTPDPDPDPEPARRRRTTQPVKE